MHPLPFQVMAKPRGPVCNLACRGCYYLTKHQLYPGADFRMSDSVLHEYTRQYLDAHPGDEVTFTWQGGEPTLMGLDFYERAIELQRRYARPGVRVANALQTNGTTLDAQWCRFFRDHDFLVGISVDGPGPCHDAIRLTPTGQPSLELAVRGVRILREHEVNFNVLTCVHQKNQHHPLEVYQFLRDELGARFIQFIPVVTRQNALRDSSSGPLLEESVSAREYGQFLIAVFDEWSTRDIGRVFVQMFDATLAGHVGATAGVCVHQETCGRALVLEFSGDLYACDHFVEPDYRLGNILETPLGTLVRSPAQRQFGRNKRARLPARCRECAFLAQCRGGCPKDRIVESGGNEPPLNYLCDSYRLFYEHVDEAMRFMAGELRAGRSPAELMVRLARARVDGEARDRRLRRNDPCPCGSGRKLKHCHGRARPG